MTFHFVEKILHLTNFGIGAIHGTRNKENDLPSHMKYVPMSVAGLFYAVGTIIPNFSTDAFKQLRFSSFSKTVLLIGAPILIAGSTFCVGSILGKSIRYVAEPPQITYTTTITPPNDEHKD